MSFEISPLEWDEERDLNGPDIWILDTAHSLPPWTPCYAWSWLNCLQPGWSGGPELLSLPSSRGSYSALVDSCCYLAPNIITDEEEKKSREPAFREAMKPWIEDYDKAWGSIVDEMLGWWAKLDPIEVEKLSTGQLFEHYDDCLIMYKRMWMLHFLGMYPAYHIYGLFEETTKSLLGINDTDPLFLRLVSGYDNQLKKSDRMLYQLAMKGVDMGLEDTFKKVPANANEMIPALEQSEKGKGWLNEFNEFLKTRGWRIPRFTEFYGPQSAPWIEDPTPAFTFLKQQLEKGDKFAQDELMVESLGERDEAVKEVLAKIPRDKRDWFRHLLDIVPKAVGFSPEHNHYLDHHANGIMRRLFKECGRRFALAGAIDDPDDVFFMVPPEIEHAILTPGLLNWRPTINRRKSKWEEDCKKDHPMTLGRLTLAEAVPMIVTDIILEKLVVGAMPEVRPELKADLYGVCGAPGVAEGPARVVMNESQFHEVRPGDVLVAVTTYSSWTPLFSVIGAAVVDHGGSLSHAAIVGRESGIPVIINTNEPATQKLKTGMKVRVDGNQGTIHVLAS